MISLTATGRYSICVGIYNTTMEEAQKLFEEQLAALKLEYTKDQTEYSLNFRQGKLWDLISKMAAGTEIHGDPPDTYYLSELKDEVYQSISQYGD